MMGVVTTTTASKISLLCLCLLGVLSPTSLTSASAADDELNKHVAIRDSVLLISTLDGSLHAVGQRTGLVKWTITDAPILQMSPTSPSSSAFNFTTDQNDQQSTSKQHLLLPDPKDGSLYLVNGFSEKKPKPLEKLPFTISELVSSSPCRSSDGMIYTSKKTDEWVVVDVTTGEKVDIINSDAPICPSTGNDGESSSSSSRSGSSSSSLPNAFENSNKQNTEKQNSRNLLYLFKSEYTISVFNAETREKLSNFTFLDYSPSIVNSIPQNSYEYLHLTSSTNGKLATIDIANGENSFLWSSHFASPIVAMYKLSEAGTVKANGFPVLSRIPFLTIGGFVNVSNIQHNSLFPSVYIGELAASKSLYALSALVDYNLIRKDSDYLIEGPKEEGESNGKSSSSSSSSANNNFFQMAGYYEFPKTTGVKFTRIRPAELIPAVPANVVTKEDKIEEKITVIQPSPQLLPDNTNIVGSLASQLDIYTSWVINLFVVVVVLLLLLIVAFAIIAYKFVYQRGDKKTKSGASSSANGSASSSSGANVSIGKISYNVGDIIGRGCAGTCVYKGKFEGRQEVAVKRIVADCFQLANREIELLRRLQHPHLIRYFATETDHQFLYIAIELAELTLAEYIERLNGLEVGEESSTLGYHFNRTDILHQSCLGLAHLHSLDIVHRDIKPANILISQPLSPSRRRKIMISDFGVSKILNSESLTTEFSAGTEGWIAPEILKAKMFGGGGGGGGSGGVPGTLEPRSAKASKPNDIFSMGCLVYYTITGGEHPFGNLLSRQSNIINGTTDLEAIKEEEHAAVYSLVESMVAADPDSRPPIEAVVKHPFFWNAKQSLAFLQDISDRIESEKAADSPLVSALEYGSLDVCKGDWRRQLSVELQEDLRKFRNYKGSSVRDLLRAIRNKRHHYHELDGRLQAALGAIPGEFVTYFTSKFPRLIVHSYIGMQACRGEEVFQHYYHLGGSEGSGNGNGNGDENSGKSGFKWRPLPRTNIRWFDRYKDEGSNKLTRSPETFVFDRRTIKIKTYNVQTGNGNAILTRAVDNNKGIPAASSNNNSTNSSDQVSEEAETTSAAAAAAAAADLNQNHSKLE